MTHHFCLFQTYNTDEDLKSFYKVLSTNTDGNTEFVSTVEGDWSSLSDVVQQDSCHDDCCFLTSVQLTVTPFMERSGIQRKMPLSGPDLTFLTLHRQSGRPSTRPTSLWAKVWKHNRFGVLMLSICSSLKLWSVNLSVARKNFHRFQSKEEEIKALIYNYNPVYTGNASAFEQIYLFWDSSSHSCSALIWTWYF